MTPPAKITLPEWDARYRVLEASGQLAPAHGGPLGRHVSHSGDLCLEHLRFDNSLAGLRLWNLLLSEEDRLREHRAHGRKLVGAMKDLGTVPVIAYALRSLVAFYPDGAWWIPCLMQCSDRLFQVADRLGIDESFCPVRAMLGAFVTQAHFPLPDLLICSVGAVCDDFSAIAQRLESLGHSIFWWEIPRRRNPDPDELSILLPGGLVAPAAQVAFVRSELDRVRAALSKLADQPLDDAALSAGILEANAVRQRVARLRRLVAEAPLCPLPALEMLIVDALAIHYCSDRMETLAVLDELLAEVELRVNRQQGVLPADAARIYWVNPVADLCAMNLVEACGGRICGADYLFSHAILDIPEELPPLEALARIALADRMVGPARDRARQIGDEARSCDAEAVIVSRIPGASHCAWEGTVIASEIAAHLDILVMEIEVPPLTDGTQAALRSRLEALVETVRGRRGR